jgi:glycerol-3-phosphate acyltransferase PlsX
LKGNDAVRGAAARLRGGMMPIRFHGFVEGDDIMAGTVDVVVTDGFTGNVALKTAEGAVKMFAQSLRVAFGASPLAKLGYLLARGALRKMQTRIDPRRYNGAMFLGLRGIAVKSHGSTDAFGFANAVGVAIDLKLGGFLDKIGVELQRLNDAQPTPEPVSTAAL